VTFISCLTYIIIILTYLCPGVLVSCIIISLGVPYKCFRVSKSSVAELNWKTQVYGNKIKGDGINGSCNTHGKEHKCI
jgi:hypothetical protein